eukprot:scaffold6789_cov115-Isochrysis_galbana.AAC.9
MATSQAVPEADGAPVIRPFASGSAQRGQTKPHPALQHWARPVSEGLRVTRPFCFLLGQRLA